jgi:predicted nucleic acid-binding Zn ribbon protein
VKFRIARVSFARRVDLMRRVRELARRAEFLGAGQEPADKMDAALLQAEIEQLYVTWGVKAVQGLTVNGIAASPELLAEGPEDLFREALAAVRKELGLSQEERKNS